MVKLHGENWWGIYMVYRLTTVYYPMSPALLNGQLAERWFLLEKAVEISNIWQLERKNGTVCLPCVFTCRDVQAKELPNLLCDNYCDDFLVHAFRTTQLETVSCGLSRPSTSCLMYVLPLGCLLGASFASSWEEFQKKFWKSIHLWNNTDWMCFINWKKAHYSSQTLICKRKSHITWHPHNQYKDLTITTKLLPVVKYPPSRQV